MWREVGIVSGNGLSPVRLPAITWPIAELLSFGPRNILKRNFIFSIQENVFESICTQNVGSFIHASICWHPWSAVIFRLPFGSVVWWHDDVIKWKHFPRYWPFVRGIHRSPVNSPHKGQLRGAFMFSMICARTNGWVNNGEAGDLRRHRVHYDVIVMKDVKNHNQPRILWKDV